MSFATWVGHTRGWELLRDSSRQHRNNTQIEEQRGRKRLISAEDLKELERIIQEDNFEARALIWEAIGYEAGLDVSGDTIRKALGKWTIISISPAEKDGFQRKLLKNQVDFAIQMLSKYPKPEDWYNIVSRRFTGGLGPKASSMSSGNVVSNTALTVSKNRITDTVKKI